LAARATRRHEKSEVKSPEGALILYLAREEAQSEAENMTRKPSKYNVLLRRALARLVGAEARGTVTRAVKSEYNCLQHGKLRTDGRSAPNKR
jgi:hypothetical protein